MAAIPERRVALIHRVIVPDEEPREYAVLATDRRSVFIRQPKSRSNFVLRGEMKYGTALVTDVQPKTLEDYQATTLEALTSSPANLTVFHEQVASLALKKEVPTFRLREWFVWLTMKMQREVFQVYHIELTHESPGSPTTLKFYLVPLGAYFKPRRQTETREAILRAYAMEALEIYRNLLRPEVVSSEA